MDNKEDSPEVFGLRLDFVYTIGGLVSSFACLCGVALGDASENLKPLILLRFVEYGVVLGRCWFCLRRLSSKSLVVKSFPGLPTGAVSFHQRFTSLLV